jgi:endonuclease-8
VPEGHVIHRAARDHTKRFANRTVAISSPQGRFAAGAAVLSGQTLTDVEALGKHLLYRWSGGDVLHVHLGLFGKFRVWTAQAPEPRDTVRLRLATPDATLDLTGPTICGLIDPPSLECLRGRIGPDPLRPDADVEAFVGRARRSRVAIGALLLDQSAVAGVGNVYRAEALFVAGIHPLTPSREIDDDTLRSLWETLRTMLTAGVTSGRIVTVSREDADRPPSRLRRGERTYVYRQTACRRCAASVTRQAVAARPLYWCPGCQAEG